jgi:hypothetical protein
MDRTLLSETLRFLSTLKTESIWKSEEDLSKEIWNGRGDHLAMNILHPEDEVREHLFYDEAIKWFMNAYV